MILYELLTGAPPYAGEAIIELIVAIATAPPPHPCALRPEVPPALDEAVVRAMAKRPDQRFPDLAAFASALAPFGGHLAWEREQNTKTALSVQAKSAPLPIMSGAAVVPSDEQITMPTGVVAGKAPPIESHTDLTSSVELLKRGRTQRIALAAGMAMAGVGVVTALLWSQRVGSDTAAAPSGVAASIASNLPPPPNPEATVEPLPSSSAAASPPASSASAGKKPPKATAAPPRAPRKPVDTSLLREFSDRKKKP
jgi:serine/threonine protein kinase